MNKLSIILVQNSVYESTVAGLDAADVWNSICASGSTEIPICATLEKPCAEKACGVLDSSFIFDTLKMALGLAFEIKPRYCQLPTAFGLGQLKYTEPPRPSGKGWVPVMKTTI